MAKPKILVIDACVARAAGPPASEHPTSTNCREILEEVRSHHKIVLTKTIAAEWNKHQSHFARRWRLSMHAHKKIQFIDHIQNDCLRDRLARLAQDAAVADIILKDVHLVEAAIATDHRIISLEMKCFSHLCPIASEVKEIAQIAIVNPNDEAQEPILWLRNGAPITDLNRLSKNRGI